MKWGEGSSVAVWDVAVWQSITVYYGVTRPAHSRCDLSGYSSVMYRSTCQLWCVHICIIAVLSSQVSDLYKHHHPVTRYRMLLGKKELNIHQRLIRLLQKATELKAQTALTDRRA